MDFRCFDGKLVAMVHRILPMVWFALSVLCAPHAVQAAEPAPPPSPVKPPELAEKERQAAIAKALTALGADDFETRNSASKQLVALGTGALPELKAAFKTTRDAEVGYRLAEVIKKLEVQQQMDTIAEGLIALPSGLKYKVLAKGTGAIPKASDTVRCHYTGKFMDGKVFDSSHQRNEPADFPVKGVIAGWTEALQLMPAGSKWLLVIPPELGYGKRGAPPTIPPDATLIFEVELLSIRE